jgi:hypothetical protein
MLWSLPLQAEDLDAGKSAETLFATHCAGCHHTARGLAHRLSGWSLGSFMRSHYTATRDSADRLTQYLESVRGGASVRTAPGKPSAGNNPPARQRGTAPRPPADVAAH